VRVGSDYTLKNDEQTGDLVVVAGTATVEGESHDTVVVFGNAEISSTANIEGSLVLIDTDTNVAEGAHLHGDLVVIGGQFNAPADFAEWKHVVIDNHTLGGRLEGLFAQITAAALGPADRSST
jgi:formylmethanofuran dehydrogenase subunit C